MVSAGRSHLQLDQWMGALEGKLMFSDLTIDGYVVRLTEPQARAAFYASAAAPKDGLLPDELPVCVARTACGKYKQVSPMGPGAKVTGFLSNLLGEEDEEDVVGAARRPESHGHRAAGQRRRARSTKRATDGVAAASAPPAGRTDGRCLSRRGRPAARPVLAAHADCAGRQRRQPSRHRA